MTTLPKYHGIDEIFRGLDFIRARRWLLRLITGVLAVATVAIATVVVLGAALGYWPDQPPVLLRWALLIGAIAGLLTAVVWFVLRAVFWRQNPAQTARFVEQELPEMRNDLINSVLLSEDGDQVSPELVQLAIHEAVVRTKRADLRQSVSARPLARWVLAAGVAGLVLAAFAVFQPGPLRRGLRGAVAPTAYVERVNEIELLSPIRPEDGATCFVGETVNVVATIRNEQAAPYRGQVLMKGGEASLEMFPANGFTTFTLPLQNVQQSFDFAVQIGQSRWPADKPYYHVNVLQRVQVEGLDLTYDYPAYTALPTKAVRNAPGSIEAPLGTKVTITLRTASPVRNVRLELQGDSPRPMRGDAERRSFSADVDILTDGAYRIVLEDTHQQLPDPEQAGKDTFGAAGQSLLKGYYRIHAEPDAPPKIEFVSPNRDVSVPPGGKLQTLLRVYDKYGLTDARFYAGKEGTEPNEVHRYGVHGKSKADLPFPFELPKGLVKGDVVVYYATVTDNRDLPDVGGPQTSTSGRFKVLVQDAEEAAAEKAKRYDELRQKLMDILRMQEAQRVNAGICWKEPRTLEQVLQTAGEVVAGQKAIRNALIDLAEKFPFDPEMVSVQQAVAILASNEARLAIDQAEVVAKLARLEERDEPCKLLTGTQDRILDTLQTLLAIMPSLAGKEKAKENGPRPGDLPPDALEKVKALRDKLEEFLEDQKKVIAATERLTKKPVDNFNAEDEELLKELATTEDKWEKFMNEAFGDFSRLVEQDFSNPAMLKELMAVKSDITMAKDALKKKATEIATAAEDGALGGGEEIKDNLEKWLPDEPDRIKWAMESIPDNQGKIELPELPTELEDLVGDLLEKEEELFEDMDDLNARAASSGSDGIGWDAMDGPISNMGAQGVTGNQLPNTNELSGRSGEGRSGKSSGEFVEDKAVGKGGRRTPTRLTPEPFQKGQVNDTSKEPPGGATGGGKFSGSGAEGLEGPVPPDVKKEMPRMAKKQASLVNKAERLRGQFKVNDYAGFKFLQAITLMSRVQRDLEKGRYQNVLRAKNKTLAALRQSKLRIGNIDVTEDTSSAMPKYIRDDIADAMKGKLPEEFRDVLEHYYRRLSENPQK
ncbi:MAG TPA: hypothetical protein VM031_01255 [Phycisphaerae bacterium]|nr:hypothetical protein [Phycisphaerae bacterium]